MTTFVKLLNLASLLASERGVTVQELLEDKRFGYSSRSSIYGDFQNIFTHFGMNVIATEEKRGKSGRETVQKIDSEDWKDFRSRFIQKVLSDDERLLLGFMLESTASNSPLVSATDRYFLSNIKSLVGEITVEPTEAKGYFSLDNVKNLLMLLRAQKEESLLIIEYNGTDRKLYPLKCFTNLGGIYCLVMQNDGLTYTISVPRITRITKPLTKSDTPRPDAQIDINSILNDPFGIISDSKIFTAVVKLSEKQGSYELERTWPDSVKIEKTDDGFLFTVRTSGRYMLERWIMSLGTEAELLEPVEIREELISSIQSTLQNYRKRK